MKDIFPDKDGLFKLQWLGYSVLPDAISYRTLQFHHERHHKAYIDNLNKALENSPLKGKGLIEVVLNSEGGMNNNAGQVYNHDMYFEQFHQVNHDRSEKIDELLVRDFGSIEAFQKEFEQKGLTLFGSGWVWLSQDRDGKLVITQHANADTPLRLGLNPLLTFDVWEHAYYLDYQNRRADYLASLWKYIEWKMVESRLESN